LPSKQRAIKHRPLKHGLRGTNIDLGVYLLRRNRALEPIAKRLTSIEREFGPQRFEVWMGSCPFNDRADDIRQGAVVERRLKCPKVSNQIGFEIRTLARFGQTCAGQGVKQKCVTCRPVAIQRSPRTAAGVGDAHVRDGTDAIGQEELPRCGQCLRTGPLLAGVDNHPRRLWHNLRQKYLWRKLCHMSKVLSADAPAFFAELERDNSREFWTANKARYETAIRPSFLNLLACIEGFGTFRIYRPHNDTRFGTDKGPYKTFIGAVAERPDGVGVFVQVSAKGLLVGSGIPMPPKDQLDNLRNAIADPATGAQLTTAITVVEAAGATVHGGRWEPLKRVPKGFVVDHPLGDMLRWKGLEINSREARPSWLSSEQTFSRINDVVARGDALHEWLGRHVGPTALTPEERFAPKRR
jgi:uncharacterized protein (TIGR02453 family)